MSFGIAEIYQRVGGVWCIHFQNGKSHILEDETRTSTHPATKALLHTQMFIKKLKTATII